MEQYRQTLRVLNISAWPALEANLTPEVVEAMILYRNDVIECQELEEKEFELESTKWEKTSNRTYNLESIPEYLFSGKAEIISSLVTIRNLTKNIEQTELFQDAEIQINRRDKIALIGKNGAGKTTLLKMIIGRE